MEPIGTAQLVEVKNSAGATVKAWDLRPFGGDPLHMGLPGSPLPPEGTFVDRTLRNGRILRVEARSGEVFEVSPGDPPPTVGPTGGPTATMGGGFFKSPMVLAIAAGAAWFMFGRRKRR